MIEEWSNGQVQKLFVYQRGKWFVVSDDYIVLFAALNGLPDYVPCWVLGKPEGDLVRDVQGPNRFERCCPIVRDILSHGCPSAP